MDWIFDELIQKIKNNYVFTKVEKKEQIVYPIK